MRKKYIKPNSTIYKLSSKPVMIGTSGENVDNSDKSREYGEGVGDYIEDAWLNAGW